MKLLLGLAFVLLATTMVSAQEPELIVAKTIMTRTPTSNSEMLVSIRIFNEGDGPAYDLTLTDATWLRENFTADAGLLTATFEKLEPGQSITHNFVVIPPKAMVMRSYAAQVSYHTAARGGRELIAHSSVPNYGWIRIYRPNEVPAKALPHYTEWGVFVGLLVAALALPALNYVNSRATFAAIAKKK